MVISVGRRTDQVRVLSDLSGLVVGALLDDDTEAGPENDAFAEALRRYREEGAPQLTALWRTAVATTGVSDRAARVLRHLARDLVTGVTTVAEVTPTDATSSVDAPPPNVRPITDAREVPALEQASDGTWRPSGAQVSLQVEIDASARRRSVPSLRSRYPELGRGKALDLPPAPLSARFTQMTAPPPTIEPRSPAREPVTTPPQVTTASPAASAPGAPVEPMSVAPTRVEPPSSAETFERAPLVERESVIKAVAGGTEVIAGPFARFQQLAAFVKALRAQPGVQDVTTRQFVRGMVHLRVRHSHSVALEDRLTALAEFRPTITSSTRDRIELTVEPPDDAPSPV